MPSNNLPQTANPIAEFGYSTWMWPVCPSNNGCFKLRLQFSRLTQSKAVTSHSMLTRKYYFRLWVADAMLISSGAWPESKTSPVLSYHHWRISKVMTKMYIFVYVPFMGSQINVSFSTYLAVHFLSSLNTESWFRLSGESLRWNSGNKRHLSKRCRINMVSYQWLHV